ncbi:MAG: hypothetical protein K2L02_01630 [Clostridia bacterium]|nr:hypothetical protein [Clostridia bacterium]
MRKTLSLLLSGITLSAAAFGIYGCSNDDTSNGNVPDGYVKAGEYLFAEDVEKDGSFYNYCPSILQVDENTRYVYYCANETKNVVVDTIAMRKGVKIDNEWYYGPKSYPVKPTLYTWDHEHDCDPAVVMGEFAYNGETYNYLMAFLGCARQDCQVNEVGLAVAKAPEGPWVKCDDVNPFIHYEYDAARPAAFQWGYGQPSLVNIDKKGKVLLSYTCGPGGDDYVELGRWDLSNLNAPVNEFKSRVPVKGMTQFNSTQAAPCITNADFAYDFNKKRLYMICDAHPLDTANQPDFITQALYVGYLQDFTGEENVPGDILKNYDGRPWKTVGFVTPDMTGYKRNHNGCIIRDGYGGTLYENRLPIGYSVCYDINLGTRPQLFSYRLRECSFDL